jgi:hypothetical protein
MNTTYLLLGAAAVVVFLICRHNDAIMPGEGVSVGPPESGEALPDRTAVSSQNTLEKGQFLRGSTLSPPGTSSMRFGSTAGGGSKVIPDSGALVPPGSYPAYRKR